MSDGWGDLVTSLGRRHSLTPRPRNFDFSYSKNIKIPFKSQRKVRRHFASLAQTQKCPEGHLSVFARVMGFEPTAFPVTGERSNQLSYTRFWIHGFYCSIKKTSFSSQIKTCIGCIMIHDTMERKTAFFPMFVSRLNLAI